MSKNTFIILVLHYVAKMGLKSPDKLIADLVKLHKHTALTKEDVKILTELLQEQGFSENQMSILKNITTLTVLKGTVQNAAGDHYANRKIVEQVGEIDSETVEKKSTYLKDRIEKAERNTASAKRQEINRILADKNIRIVPKHSGVRSQII